MSAPESPLITQEPIIATHTTKARVSAAGLPSERATTYMPAAALTPTRPPFRRPSHASFTTRARSLPRRSSPRVRPRSATASAWQPVLPD